MPRIRSASLACEHNKVALEGLIGSAENVARIACQQSLHKPCERLDSVRLKAGQKRTKLTVHEVVVCATVPDECSAWWRARSSVHLGNQVSGDATHRTVKRSPPLTRTVVARVSKSK